MTDKRDLKPGSFYWVRPEFDVDFVPPGFEGRAYDEKMHQAMWEHWSNNDQPARFEGVAADGQLLWTYLGESESRWPVVWIGNEIKQ